MFSAHTLFCLSKSFSCSAPARARVTPRQQRPGDIGAATVRRGSNRAGRQATAVEVRGSFRPSKVGSLYKLIKLLNLDPLKQFQPDPGVSIVTQDAGLEALQSLEGSPRDGRAQLLDATKIGRFSSMRRHPAFEDDEDEKIEQYVVTKLNPRHAMARRDKRPRRTRRNPTDEYRRFVKDYLDPDKQFEGNQVPNIQAGEALDYDQVPASAFSRVVLLKQVLRPKQ